MEADNCALSVVYFLQQQKTCQRHLNIVILGISQFFPELPWGRSLVVVNMHSGWFAAAWLNRGLPRQRPPSGECDRGARGGPPPGRVAVGPGLSPEVRTHLYFGEQ